VLAALAASVLAPLTAEAGRCRDDYRRAAYNDNRWDDERRGYHPQSWRANDRPFFSTYGGKVVQGGLVGAGVGAATGVVFNKPVLKSTVIGSAVGAGVQAVRYGNW
jgi:hypothetical protein